MPDMTMCLNEDCKMKRKCYRHEAKPASPQQPYARFVPEDDGECEHFLKMRR